MFERTASEKSLMNKRKKVGSGVEPCKTPVSTASSGDNFYSYTINVDDYAKLYQKL